MIIFIIIMIIISIIINIISLYFDLSLIENKMDIDIYV